MRWRHSGQHEKKSWQRDGQHDKGWQGNWWLHARCPNDREERHGDTETTRGGMVGGTRIRVVLTRGRNKIKKELSRCISSPLNYLPPRKNPPKPNAGARDEACAIGLGATTPMAPVLQARNTKHHVVTASSFY